MGVAEGCKTKGRVQIPCGHSGGPSKKVITAENERVNFRRLLLFSCFCLFAIIVLLKVLLFLFFQEKKKKKMFDKSEFEPISVILRRHAAATKNLLFFLLIGVAKDPSSPAPHYISISSYSLLPQPRAAAASTVRSPFLDSILSTRWSRPGSSEAYTRSRQA